MSHSPSSSAAQQRPLYPRLHIERDGGPLRLSDLFRGHYLPWARKHLSRRTIAEVRTSFRWWRRLTRDPPLAPLAEPQDKTAARFSRRLLKATPRRGRKRLRRVGQSDTPTNARLSPRTVVKICRAIQHLLDLAAPPRAGLDRSRRNRPPHLKEPIFATAPVIPLPHLEDEEVEDAYSLEHVATILTACPATSRGVFWRSVVTIAYNTGLRIGSLRHLRWDALIEDELGEWIRPPRYAGPNKRVPRLVYLNAAARDALSRLPRSGELVFDWRGPSGKPVSSGTWHKALNKLLDRTATNGSGAQSQPADDVSRLTTTVAAPHYGFHGLRKCFTTELSAINALVVPLALGHARSSRHMVVDGGGMAAAHYVHRRALAEALEKLPQPAFSLPADPQRRLFE